MTRPLSPESQALLDAFRLWAKDALVNGRLLSEWLAAIEDAVRAEVTEKRLAAALHSIHGWPAGVEPQPEGVGNKT